MRCIGHRHALSDTVARRLQRETQEIAGSADRVGESALRYRAARRAEWFAEVVETLGRMAGIGERCMGCSGSEAAQVEHFRPQATFPELALCWENLLWLCGLCNLTKGTRFNEATAPVNPIDEKVWDHLFIDEFGNLCARWNTALGCLDPRALHTIDLLGLDRQALQEARLARLIDLRQKVRDSLQLLRDKRLTHEDLEQRVLEWFEQPFQPDVADYFFEGPGRLDESEPFRQFFETLSA